MWCQETNIKVSSPPKTNSSLFFSFWATPGGVQVLHSEIVSGRLRGPGRLGIEPGFIPDWLLARLMLYHCVISPIQLFTFWSLFTDCFAEDFDISLGPHVEKQFCSPLMSMVKRKIKK